MDNQSAQTPGVLVDAGIEKIHFQVVEPGGRVLQERSIVHRGRLEACLRPEQSAWNVPAGCNASLPGIHLTGKLSREASRILGGGTRFFQKAALSRAASVLFRERNRAGGPPDGVGIIDFSASGYCIAVAGEKGDDPSSGLVNHPACGAGSGVNLRRVLNKLDIDLSDVDRVLAPYLGAKAVGLRRDLPVRTERCGVFSVSATVSDKNQGIPIGHALAVTMKSEVLKPCSRLPDGVRTVFLTGGVFRWQFMRDCAADELSARGVEEIRYDEQDSLMLLGLADLVRQRRLSLPAAPPGREEAPGHRPGRPIPWPSAGHSGKDGQDPLPSFHALCERLVNEGRYVRLPDGEFPGLAAAPGDRPVNVAVDMGSSMAKMVIADAASGEPLYQSGLPNRGDALQTVRRFTHLLRKAGADGLCVQNWGLTGSGRYQIGQILEAVYPHLRGRILTMVENEAHVLGSLSLLQRHVADLKRREGASVNGDFALLVDIGGEDTKISVISLKKQALLENAMNCKCSAGTGSLMDVLKDLLDIPDVALAYRLAGEAERAWRMNATCAVFLMEETRRMQARGVCVPEILASCCHAVVENMARTLWRQVTVLPDTVVLLHGQTMKSDPLALATLDRLEAHGNGPMYGLVPPHPGHRACYGLLSRMAPATAVLRERCDWDRIENWAYERTLFACTGRVCGNERMRCTRTVISSHDPVRPLKLIIGGCTTVNDRPEASPRQGREVPDAYREIWEWLDRKHPQSRRPDRLVIPRCFSLSREAYRFAALFTRLGLPVHVDAVREGDVAIGQPFFTLDTCAPNMGATGQCIRLAGEAHGLILLPQMDFLPTRGASLGRSCTTNQGGLWAAVQFARQVHPGARFQVPPLNLGEQDPDALTRQIHRSLQGVFDLYGVRIDLPDFRDLWQEAVKAEALLDDEKAELTAGYLEGAAAAGIPVTVVCGRDYVLNPGIYDSHISKMLKDKGILPVPSYAFDTPLDPCFSQFYWKTAHDIATKAAAVAEGRLHELVGHPRLKAALRCLEKKDSPAGMSHAVVTTFHCGPDSVTAPLMQEVSRTVPALWIQSDGTMAELAHMENRISTHLRRLEAGGRMRNGLRRQDLRMEMLGAFNLDGLDRATDVVYFPTMGDNRMLTALVRAMGFSAVDNYSDGGYDLEKKAAKGRPYVGDAVCLPLAAVFGDMLLAVEDFLAKKQADDPVCRGRNRIVLFMHGGDGPCRLGQYIQVFKVMFCRIFGGPEVPGPEQEGGSSGIRLLENVSSSLTDRNDCRGAFEPWVGILAYQGLVAQGLFHSLLLKAAANCRDEASFRAMTADYRKLKEGLVCRIEQGARPGRAGREMVRFICRSFPALTGPAQYLGYGLFRNFGLRAYFRTFARRWILPYGNREGRRPLRIHLDGEVYMRTCQAEAILNFLTNHLGHGVFEMTLTPTWCFLEAVLYTRLLAARDRWADLAAERRGGGGISDGGRLVAEQNRQERIVADTKRTIGNLRDLLARPLYAAGGVTLPHGMDEIYAAAAPIIPTGKPCGELVPFVGEAVLRCREGVDLILNVAPEGCMVSGMGDMLMPSILAQGQGEQRTAMVSLCSRGGEIREEEILMALLKVLGDRWNGVLPEDAP